MKGSSKAVTSARDPDFVIHVDDGTMHIVEIQTKTTFALFSASKNASTPPAGVASRPA